MSFAASLFAPRPRAAVQGFRTSNGWIPNVAAPPTAAGVQVDEQIALQVTAVYRALAIISDAIAMLPIAVYQRIGDRREEVHSHPVAELLRRPNPQMTSVDLRAAKQAHALGYGNGYTNIRRTERGVPIELWPLLPDRTRPERRDLGGGEWDVVYRTVVGGKTVTVEPADVAHVHGMAFDGIQGYSPLYIARNTIGLAMALERFGGKFFANDAKSGGFLQHPGKLGEPAVKNLRESMSGQGGLDNAHRIKILEEGMKYVPTTIAPEDAQFLMTRAFQVEEIARLFGIPLHLLQSHSKTTSWGSGIAQMSLGFLIYTLEPWIVRWEQELARKLFTPMELSAGFYIKHNVNALLRADPQTRASFYTAALNKATGWMVRDEVRALEDLNPDGIENEPPSPQMPSASPRFPPADQGPEEPEDG